MKPQLKILQDFIKPYFRYKCPIVKYKKEEWNGLANTEKNIIYINSENDHLELNCMVGEVTYKPSSKIKLKGSEGYFFTLLHEVGHFKIPFKVKSRKFEKIKADIKKELGVTKTSLDSITYSAEDYFKKDSEYFEFRSWLKGGSMTQHIKVNEWAIKEFRRKRKDINKIIKNIK
ncbi:hypothetical protein A2W67_02670 [Candidatus Nomurabacteria bacterium RIFCSPLOWO2_02_40_28]|uniref:Uncharacterized protein n=2 Tax=Candidatus Nomuraibacteriota TaxID=1752729 RepID=A0A837HTK1_9BACT|nr:MAG: hypothetical protein UT27_C0007G0042 [Candidatus Nomurabacteria bacterium GW2011_GWD2_39_12]KKR20386.1 MAG: hypothetical protein UT51_C0004G0045 [Candidatus Nomurabacteria bacterium GW2011_GWC2_39_41]KKR37103.1 MAG: hypothetical protein UT70_C0003G0045 [Candidatus Nomurabacteria bacterium GW2011_GWE2_40_10]KKR38286.1 MAG: hypothetical protein UT73_C0004G0031 [Candidatus Nomurabacteria bacterium GW2011_GWB1_40_11]KKR39828.1 MAG: hypothetical protein UT74_C0005G0045 [Parcubacteria group b